MTTRLTTLGTLQYSSFGGSKFFLAKAAHTTSSTLDDLQLDITLQILKQISEFLSLSGITLPHSGVAATHGRIQRKGRRRRGSDLETEQEVGRELPSPSLFKEEALQLRKGERLGQKTLSLPLLECEINTDRPLRGRVRTDRTHPDR